MTLEDEIFVEQELFGQRCDTLGDLFEELANELEGAMSDWGRLMQLYAVAIEAGIDIEVPEVPAALTQMANMVEGNDTKH